jgi:Cu/Zn superoxide dismutase
MPGLRAIAAVCAMAGGLLAWQGLAGAAGLEFEIVPVGDSGVTGSGTLAPSADSPGEESLVNLELAGLEPNSEHANHIYDGASCDDIGDIVFDLDNIVADADGNAAVTTTLSTSTQVFAEQDHVIIIHASADPTPIACAVLPSVEPATGRGNPPGIGGAEETQVIAPPSTGDAGLLANRDGATVDGYGLGIVGGVLLAAGLASLFGARWLRRV